MFNCGGKRSSRRQLRYGAAVFSMLDIVTAQMLQVSDFFTLVHEWLCMLQVPS